VTALLGDTAVNSIVLFSAIGPVIITIVICFLFFRAARRNDEREALEQQDGRGPSVREP
jgi:hypothetical protein